MRIGYYDDLRKRSDYPETINDDGRDWARRDASENATMREEFDGNKKRLIKEWEKKNGKSWPIYVEDIYSDSGKRIRRKGDRYDAHHVQPLTYGGENSSPNLTPLHVLDHYDKKGVHAPDSPYGRIGKLFY